MSEWNGHPKPGSKWKRPAIYRGTDRTPAETRHVIDRTLGGEVLYVPGRWSQRHLTKSRCTLEEWKAWAQPYAKEQLRTWRREVTCCYDCATPQERMSRMIVCKSCGNKRCPHGTSHLLACTGSNEPNQTGSRYAMPPSPLPGGGQHG